MLQIAMKPSELIYRVVDYRSFYQSWVNEPLGDYEQWAKDSGIGIDASPVGDFDGDGLPNLYEYGLGGDPNDPRDQGTMPTFNRYDRRQIICPA